MAQQQQKKRFIFRLDCVFCIMQLLFTRELNLCQRLLKFGIKQRFVRDVIFSALIDISNNAKVNKIDRKNLYLHFTLIKAHVVCAIFSFC